MRSLQELLSAYRAIQQQQWDLIRRAREKFDHTPDCDLVDEDDESLFGATGEWKGDPLDCLLAVARRDKSESKFVGAP
jgi:hypothetical protein